MRVLKPSRKRLKPGDVFVLQPDEQYLFGRIVSTNAVIGPMTGCILIYIYRVRSASMQVPPRSDLSPDKLLIPPIMTNRLPWSRGYFETIAHMPLEPGDAFEQHCFRTFRGRHFNVPVYYDDASHELPEPVEPVGSWGLDSFRTIDDKVSDALGIARVPAQGRRTSLVARARLLAWYRLQHEGAEALAQAAQARRRLRPSAGPRHRG